MENNKKNTKKRPDKKNKIKKSAAGKTKKKQNKNLGGRPTKYKNEVTIKKVDMIIDAMTLEKFYSFCGIEHVCLGLGIVKDTLYRWKKKYPMFSDAIKRWETKRNALFYSLAQQMPPGVFIFLCKNWLSMTDRQELEHVGSDIKPLKLILENKNPNGSPDEKNGNNHGGKK